MYCFNLSIQDCHREHIGRIFNLRKHCVYDIFFELRNNSKNIVIPTTRKDI